MQKLVGNVQLERRDHIENVVAAERRDWMLAEWVAVVLKRCANDI
jgi:hypothetical protein